MGWLKRLTWMMAVGALGGAVALLPTGASAAGGGGSISGAVFSATTGQPIAGVSVELYQDVTFEVFGGPVTGPQFLTSTTSADDGTYTISGLARSNRDGYFVCFDTFGTDLDAYQSQCWADQQGFFPFPDPFGFVQLPFGTAGIHVGTGQHVTGIDADMVNPRQLTPADSGSITGTVTRKFSGAGLGGVVVTAFNAGSRIFGQAVTNPDGTYEIDNLPAVPVGYQVCVDASRSHGASPPAKFKSECFGGIRWTGGKPPADATRVRVRHGETTDGIDVALPH